MNGETRQDGDPLDAFLRSAAGKGEPKAAEPELRSTGLTRRVLLALRKAPTGCFIVSGYVVGALIAQLSKPLVLPLIKRVLCALIPSCDPLQRLP